jgi:hypothetical protein
MVKKGDKKPTKKHHPAHPTHHKKKVHHVKQKQKQHVNVKVNVVGGSSSGGGGGGGYGGGIMHSERVIERLPQTVGSGAYSLNDVSNFIRSIQVPAKQAEKLPETLVGPTSTPLPTTVGKEIREPYSRRDFFTPPHKSVEDYHSSNDEVKKPDEVKKSEKKKGGRPIGAVGIKKRTEMAAQSQLTQPTPLQPRLYISATPRQHIDATGYHSESTIQTVHNLQARPPRPLATRANQRIPTITDSDSSLIHKKKK